MSEQRNLRMRRGARSILAATTTLALIVPA